MYIQAETSRPVPNIPREGDVLDTQVFNVKIPVLKGNSTDLYIKVSLQVLGSTAAYVKKVFCGSRVSCGKSASVGAKLATTNNAPEFPNEQSESCCIVGNVVTFLTRKRNMWNKIGEIYFEHFLKKRLLIQ